MSPAALALLRGAVGRLGSITAVALDLGYARASVSMALAGKYPGRTTKMEQAIVSRYGGCECPHLGRAIGRDECRRHRTRRMPQSDPDAFRHWRACQHCPVGAAFAEADAQGGPAHA